MNAKTYLIAYYSVAGVIISLFTAVMTYYIIDVPIGEKMMFKIFLTILATLPIIALLSYLIGACLSKRLFAIRHCLNNIHEDKFLEDKHEESITDISAIHESIHQLSNRLEQSISTLKASNEQLNTMILSLSHDIRTPLTIMEGYIEELEDGIVSKEDKPKVLAILKRETAYMKELSAGVIAYIQSLGSDVFREEIVLKPFVQKEIVPLLQIHCRARVDLNIEESFTLSFDKMALKNILLNLLHNACKYSAEGEILLRVEAKKIYIEDRGEGIDPKYKETIFEPFYCLDESRNRNNGGFGLGLSIAKNLAKTNGYDLFLDTAYPFGSRFVLNSSSSCNLHKPLMPS